MRLLKVECKKTLIMKVFGVDIWEDEEQTLLNSNSLDISYFKGCTYTLLEIKKNKIYISIDENDDLHKFSSIDVEEYFNIIAIREIK